MSHHVVTVDISKHRAISKPSSSMYTNAKISLSTHQCYTQPLTCEPALIYLRTESSSLCLLMCFPLYQPSLRHKNWHCCPIMSRNQCKVSICRSAHQRCGFHRTSMSSMTNLTPVWCSPVRKRHLRSSRLILQKKPYHATRARFLPWS